MEGINIGITNNGIFTKKKTGIINAFISTMEQILNIDKENHYHLLGGNYYNLPFSSEHKVVDSGEYTKNFNFFCFLKDIKIMHSFYTPMINVDDRIFKIMTIHDLIPLINKNWHNSLYEFFDGPMRKAACSVNKIIACSENTKKDIVYYYGIKPEKINVIYWGMEKTIISEETIISERVKQISHEDYLLTVGNLVKYKNLNQLINSFIRLKERKQDRNLKLVVVGRKAWEADNINDDICKDIIYTDYVNDRELECLYENAHAFAYISLYEGFGLPILEAMSRGKAVITSETSSMPEVGGKAVEYCNPYDMESIIDAMEKVVYNESYRRELEVEAKLRASQFSYKKTAREILNIYKGVMT